MKNENIIFDITDIDIDLLSDKNERMKYIEEKIGITDCIKKYKINGTIVEMNFNNMQKLNSKIIMKALGLK